MMRIAAINLIRALACLVVLLPGLAHADRVHIGDVIDVALFGEEASWTGTVAADGTIRLSGIGTVPIAGLTFDEAEAALSEAVETVEFFISPRVSMTLTARAPVFVTGNVRNPGAFEYRPQLTAGIAAGLAGGASITGGEQGESPVAAAELAGQIALTDQEIARTLARIARVEAELSNAEGATISDTRLEMVSSPEEARQFLAMENAILDNERQASATMLSEWQREIEETQTQIELLVERIKVQDNVVALLQEELAAASSLRQRGLKTRSDLTRTERQAAETQARLLELEALLSQARSRLAESRRGRARFNKDQMSSLLEQRREATAQLDTLIQRRATAREKRFALTDQALSAGSEDLVRILYTLRRQTPSGLQVSVVDRDVQLLPGDAVDVLIVPGEGSEPTAMAPAPDIDGETTSSTDPGTDDSADSNAAASLGAPALAAETTTN